MVTLGAVYAWGQAGAWTPLLQSTASLGDVERVVILRRNPTIGPFTEVVQGADVMGSRSAGDIWSMLLQPGFDADRRDFDGDGDGAHAGGWHRRIDECGRSDGLCRIDNRGIESAP